jgi:hypothetical protein
VEDQPTRFDNVVAVTMATIFGALGFWFIGFELFAYTLFVLPALAPILLGVAAVIGGWFAVRGRRSARGFGAGMVIAWVLLAFWSSGLTLGIAP